MGRPPYLLVSIMVVFIGLTLLPLVMYWQFVKVCHHRLQVQVLHNFGNARVFDQSAEILPHKGSIPFKTSSSLEIVEAWKVGSISGRRLHSLLGLVDAVIPAAFVGFEESFPGLEREEGVPPFFLNSTIPVIGTVVVRNPQMLRRLVYSIDVPIQNLVIVHNSISGDLGKREEEEVTRELEQLQESLGSKFITVIRSGCNRGCAGGWNSILHCAPDAPWWLIINDDAAFKPGSLSLLPDFVQQYTNAVIMNLRTPENHESFRAFILTKRGVATVGVFDENIWPAYCEDCDYAWRAQLSGQAVIQNAPAGFSIIHGDLVSGTSSTLTSNDTIHQDYNRRNDCSHNNNAFYFTRKWNVSSRCKDVEQGMFKLPFNNPEHTVADWTFDYALRARTQTCWNFSNDPDTTVVETQFDHEGLQGDNTATASTRGLASIWPHGSAPNVRNIVELLADGSDCACVSAFAIRASADDRLDKVACNQHGMHSTIAPSKSFHQF